MISSKQASALLAGVSVGAVLAVLFAPQSGETTRKAIGDGLNDAGEKLTEAGIYLRDQAERLNGEAQAALQKTSAQVESALNQAANAVTTTLNEANKTFSENLEKASSAIASVAGNFSGSSGYSGGPTARTK